MKRWFSVFMVISILFVMCSCSGELPNNDDSEPAEQDFMSAVCSKDSVDEFMTAAGNMQGAGLLSGFTFTEENCYNVTPMQVAAVTDIKIFKFSDSCASFALIDGEIHEICVSFGGYGFVNAVPCDFDNDGNIDLLIASSWGSGLHRSQISVFNTKTKESTVVYDTTATDNPQVDLVVAAVSPAFSSKDPQDLPIYYHIYSAEIRFNNNNGADLSYAPIEMIGSVELENGAIVFKAAAD